MAVQYSTALRNDLASQFNVAIGTGGKLKLYTSAYGTLLATFVWTGSAFTSPATGVITLNSPDVNPVSAAATGTAALAKFTTSADVDVVTGFTVGVAGASPDVVIDNTSINSGQNVQLTYGSCTITSPAA